jgi:hypothetical protein
VLNRRNLFKSRGKPKLTLVLETCMLHSSHIAFNSYLMPLKGIAFSMASELGLANLDMIELGTISSLHSGIANGK